MRSFQGRMVWSGVVLAALTTAACDKPAETGASDMDALAVQLEQSKHQAAAPAPAVPTAEASPAPPAVEQPAPVVASRASEPAPAESSEMTEFGPTSGRRGQSFHGGGQGYLYAVFSARFVAENRIIMAQIKKNMDLFEATHDRKPNSHEEFWQAIIVDGGVSLPELEEGEDYFYDAQKEELMVRTPAPQ